MAILVGAIAAWLIPFAADVAGMTPGRSVLAGLVGAVFVVLITAWIYGRIKRQV